MSIKTGKALLLIFVCALFLVSQPLSAQETNPADFMDMVQSYLTMLEHMRGIVSDPTSAILLAQNSIKQVYEKEGRKSEAIGELAKILEGLDDPAARTAVRLSLADLYKEIGQHEKALEQLRAVIAENKAILAKR